MKRLILILVIPMLLIGCEKILDTSEYSNHQGHPAVPLKEIAHEQNITQLQHYTNERFRYSISYPANWKAQAESDNGDGKVLYSDEPFADIRVYAAYYMKGISSLYPAEYPNLQRQSYELDNGMDVDLFTAESDSQMYVEMVYVSIEDEVEFHVVAKISKSLYKELEEPLFRMIRSFDLED